MPYLKTLHQNSLKNSLRQNASFRVDKSGFKFPHFWLEYRIVSMGEK